MHLLTPERRPAAAVLLGLCSFDALMVWTWAGNGSELPLLAALFASAAVPFLQLQELSKGRTRVFALTPVVDAFNHSSRAPTAEMVAAPLTDVFYLTARGSVPSGEQLHLCYGEGKDNDALLQDYGFVERDNPADRAWLPAEGHEHAATDGGADLADPGRWVPWSSTRSDVGLRDACASRLKAMPTTLDEDEALLAADQLAPRHRLAVEWRVERKRILAQTAGLVQA